MSSADDSRALPPRPAPDPVILALLSTAAEELTRPLIVEPPAPASSEWRFSGRWFERRHVAGSRTRPF